MFGKKRTSVTEKLRSANPPNGRSRRARVRVPGEHGAALVELALTLPILLVMFTGIVSIGSYEEQDLQLTDALNVGAKELAISRGNTTDPCNLVYTAVTTAAPMLTASSMTFTYSLNGNPFSGKTCSSSSTTTGAAGDLVQGQPVTITVQYPCSVTFYYGVLLSGSTCMQAQISEMVQ